LIFYHLLHTGNRWSSLLWSKIPSTAESI